MIDPLPAQPTNGRGAIGNPTGRYERFAKQAVDDGWRHEGLWEDDDLPKIRTNLHIDTSRTVINDIDSPDIGPMRSINIYRGCEHGCIYCFARPTHSWLGFGAGLDFESEIFYKPDVAELLVKEMAARNYEVKTITLGTNTDNYQPVERGLRLTRKVIEVLARHKHPFNIITKSALVARDIDLIAPMSAQGLAEVFISVTTLDPDLARAMEPRAAAPYKRLATIKALSDAGIPVTVMVAPMIPALTDMEMENIMQAAWDAGARTAYYTLVRLPYEVKDLFAQWLQTHVPGRAEHVLSILRQMHHGKLYDSAFGARMRGQGVFAELLNMRYHKAVARFGFNQNRARLRYDLFRPPAKDGQIGFEF